MAAMSSKVMKGLSAAPRGIPSLPPRLSARPVVLSSAFAPSRNAAPIELPTVTYTFDHLRSGPKRNKPDTEGSRLHAATMVLERPPAVKEEEPIYVPATWTTASPSSSSTKTSPVTPVSTTTTAAAAPARAAPVIELPTVVYSAADLALSFAEFQKKVASTSAAKVAAPAPKRADVVAAAAAPAPAPMTAAAPAASILAAQVVDEHWATLWSVLRMMGGLVATALSLGFMLLSRVRPAFA